MRTERTRMDVMLELLDEVDAICREHGLKYSISGPLVKSILEEGTLPKEFDYIALAMTSGDINRLIKIVEKENRQDRYFEYIVNNPRQKKLDGGYRYGNSQTTLISASTYGNNMYYGIMIYIIEVKKSVKRPFHIRYNQLLHSSYLFEEEGTSNLRNSIKGFMKKRVDEQRDQKIRQETYDYFLNTRGIDKWEDIKNENLVSVSKRVFDNSEMNRDDWDIVDLKAGQRTYMYSPMLKTYIIGNRTTHGIVADLEIVDTSIPFSEIEGTGITDKVLKAQRYRNERNEIRKKGDEDFKYTRRAWRTYLMAKEIVGIKNEYEEAIKKEDKAAINEILHTYQERKQIWLQSEYPFFEVSEIEKEITKRGK